jgi:hypothetical protein
MGQLAPNSARAVRGLNRGNWSLPVLVLRGDRNRRDRDAGADDVARGVRRDAAAFGRAEGRERGGIEWCIEQTLRASRRPTQRLDAEHGAR